jgi:hypothetical protein
VRIFATVMQQDSLQYQPQPSAQADSYHQVTPLPGPLKPLLPDSIQQGIPPYANPLSKPSDSIFAQLEINPFFRTISQTPAASLFKQKSVLSEKSIFTSSQLKAENLKPQPLNNPVYNWLTGIIILSFVLYTTTQFLYAKRLKQIFHAAFAHRYLSQLIREGGIFKERITIGLLFIFFSITTVYIFQAMQFIFDIHLEYPGLTFIAIYSGLLLFWFIKVSIIKFLGFVFKNQIAAYEYNLSSLIYLEVIGLVLLPFSLPVVFQDPTLFSQIGLVIIIAGLLVNLLRGFMIGLNNTKFSLFYLIVYLCTLEILPLFIVAKIFINH